MNHKNDDILVLENSLVMHQQLKSPTNHDINCMEASKIVINNTKNNYK